MLPVNGQDFIIKQIKQSKQGYGIYTREDISCQNYFPLYELHTLFSFFFFFEKTDVPKNFSYIAETITELWDAIILVSFRDVYCVVHRGCFSNVYLYSTLTTNSASISNYNHNVNLFLFMAYWLPSFIPSSIIFWRLLLSI